MTIDNFWTFLGLIVFICNIQELTQRTPRPMIQEPDNKLIVMFLVTFPSDIKIYYI